MWINGFFFFLIVCLTGCIYYNLAVLMQAHKQLFQRRDKSNEKSYNNIQKHVKHFQRQIRQKRVEGERSQIRQSLLLSISDKKYHNEQSFLTSLSTQFAKLKNIGLQKALKDLRNVNEYEIAKDLGVIDQITQQLLAYIGSTQQLHLFQLIELPQIQKLARLIQWQNLTLFEPQPRVFVRILLILCKYSGETQEIPVCFLETLQAILNHLSPLKHWYEDRQKFLYFSHSQVKHIVELVFESLGNIGLQREQFHVFFFKSDGFLRASLQEAAKIASFIKRHQINQNSKDIQILNRIILLFERVFEYDSSQFNQSQHQSVQILLQYDFEMINYLLQVLQCFLEKDQIIEQNIAVAILTFFQNHLHIRPEILVSHNFNILFQYLKNCNKHYLDLQFRIYHYGKDLQKESQPHLSLYSLKQRLKIVTSRYLKWLSVVDIIFGMTIPTQDQSTYYELFEQWVEDYIIPIFQSVLSNHQYKMSNVIELILATLSNICLQETLLEQILDQLPILNKIFYFAKSEHSTMRQRKNSLKCITNILKVALDGQSSIKDTVKDLVSSNRVIAIVAEHLGNYVDVQLNFDLLQTLKILLESEPSETNQENRLWLSFCQQGGRVKLEKMIGMGGTKQSEQIDRFAQSILNDYCMEDI